MRTGWIGTLCLALIASGAGQGALAQDYRPSFQPGGMTDSPAGRPNEVLVLGTPHLSGLPDSFQPNMAEPLVERLAAWKPTAIAVEQLSGLLCHSMRAQSPRFDPADIETYCYDPSAAGRATGLDVPSANAQAARMLADWPADPAPTMRRKLAAIFLAAGEPGSALVQWLRLPESERHAGDDLNVELVAELEKRMGRRNETDLVAARVAAQVGLERLWSVDDQATDMGPLDDEEAYGKAIMAAWDNPATKARQEESDALNARLGEPGALLALYRASNDPSYAAQAYRSDWGPALAEPSPQGYGRRYVAYWETRNLRMVANMREVLGRRPGTRMLAIVGASHKGYYEAYFGLMRDVKLVDVMPLLR